jgi:tol-pal system protein YbgF
MRASVVVGSAFSGVLLLLAAAPTTAQDRDLRPMLDRIDRLERDINQLQRQVYRGGSGAPVPVAPSDPNSAVNAELRLDQLETQLRNLTGSVEEMTNNVDQLKRRLDKLVGDVDLRLTALEQGQGGAPSGDKAPPRGPANASNPTQPPSQSGQLGAPASPPAGGQPNTQAAARGPAANQLPSGSAQDLYNRAFGLLRQADYPAAEEAFKSFVQRYPNDALSANAQYWLGETYYVRQNYNDAVAAYAEGYRKFPQSGKGPDFLLKLGMSLGNLGQKKEACLTYNQLGRDFPTASANIKERAGQEKQRLGC